MEKKSLFEFTGTDIYSVQTYLKTNGFYNLDIDGECGKNTKNALKEYFSENKEPSWTHLMIHCSATPEGRDVTPEDIRKWHIVGRGWSRVGYSHLFGIDGQMDILIPYDRDDVIDSWEISNGASGWNGKTKHICYAGGMDRENEKPKDTRTTPQLAAMSTLIKTLIMLYPDIKLIGHNQVAAKACPSFDVPTWAREIGISEKNIDSKKYI